MIDPDSRPKFKELVQDFSAMARDPSRFLVIKVHLIESKVANVELVGCSL